MKGFVPFIIFFSPFFSLFLFTPFVQMGAQRSQVLLWGTGQGGAAGGKGRNSWKGGNVALSGNSGGGLGLQEGF